MERQILRNQHFNYHAELRHRGNKGWNPELEVVSPSGGFDGSCTALRNPTQFWPSPSTNKNSRCQGLNFRLEYGCHEK